MLARTRQSGAASYRSRLWLFAFPRRDFIRLPRFRHVPVACVHLGGEKHGSRDD
jgi:hypothetical protein